MKESWKAAPARSPDVGPSICMALANSCADLFVPGPFQRRKIDAPEMAVAVPLERLENESRRDTVGHPGLDDLSRSQVTHQAPYGPRQCGIAVVPPLKALRARSYPLRFELTDHLGPQFQKLTRLLARRGHAKLFMKPLLPARVRLIRTLRSAQLALRHVGFADRRPGFDRVGQQIGNTARRMLQQVAHRYSQHRYLSKVR